MLRCLSIQSSIQSVRSVPETAAEAAGLEVGDVITGVDAMPVDDLKSLSGIIRTKNIGETVVIAFRRGGEPRQLEAVLKKWDKAGMRD